MPPAKSRVVQEDARSDVSTIRERQIAAAAHARRSKNGASIIRNATTLKELALVSTQAGDAAPPAPGQGVGGPSTKLAQD